jgi:serine/threonine protein kinase
MDPDLENIYNRIMDAVRAEDVFGDLLDPKHKKSREEILEGLFDSMSIKVMPQSYTHPDDKELAGDAHQRLLRFYEKAKERLQIDMYGARKQLPRLIREGRLAFKTTKRQYYIGDIFAEGTIADMFEGECAISDEFAGTVAIKIVRDSADNSLMMREKNVLQELHKKNGAQRKHLPILLDHFQTEDGRVGLIFRYLENTLDMHAILERPDYRNGVDRKHMVWMLNRLLSAIGYAHKNGIMHGNIEPAHLFVRGSDHNLFIVDWCWSIVRPRETADTFRINTDNFSAPEVAQKKSPTPASDLFSVGKCMIHILGGNVDTNEMPDSVEDELQRFIQGFVLNSKLQRAQDAWQLHGQLDKLVKRLWGQKRFIPFTTT